MNPETDLDGWPTRTQAEHLLRLVKAGDFPAVGEYMEQLEMPLGTVILFYSRMCTMLLRNDGDPRMPPREEQVWGIQPVNGDEAPPMAAQLVTTMLNDDAATYAALLGTIPDAEDASVVARQLVELTADIMHAVDLNVDTETN